MILRAPADGAISDNPGFLGPNPSYDSHHRSAVRKPKSQLLNLQHDQKPRLDTTQRPNWSANWWLDCTSDCQNSLSRCTNDR